MMAKKITFFLSRQNFTPAAKHQTWKRRRINTNRQKYSSNIVACKFKKREIYKTGNVLLSGQKRATVGKEVLIQRYLLHADHCFINKIACSISEACIICGFE